MHEGNFRSWAIWFVAGLLYLYEFVHRIAISVMIPELSISFSASVTAIGALSASYFYAYASAQIPVGMLLDEYGTKNLLTISCVIISVASLFFAMTNDLLYANVCRFFIGFASAFSFAGCLKLSATWFPANKFAFIVGLTNLMGILGAILGGNPLAHAVDLYGWRKCIIMSSAAGFALSILIWRIVDDSRATTQRKEHYLHNLLYRLTTVAKMPQIWLNAVFSGCLVAPITTYAELWGVSYLMRTYELNRPDAANINSIVFLGIAIGGPTLGFISDYFRQRKILLLIGGIGAACAFLLIIFCHTLNLNFLYFLHFALGFFTSAMLLCFTLNSELSIAGTRATSIALTNSVIMIMGALLQTICSSLLHRNLTNYTIGLLPLLICYVTALICYYFIREPKCAFSDDE